MKVVVVGGGVTGLFVSYYLVRDGHKVTVVDENPQRAATSIFNAGLVTPSTGVVPNIGMREIVASFFRRSGPVYISPLEIFRNLKWFRIGARRGLTGYEKAVSELGHRSLELYLRFFRDEEIDPDATSGVAGLYLEERSARAAASASGARFLDRNELLELGFTGFGGGAYSENELSINPLKLYDGLVAKLVAMGVDFSRGTRAELKATQNNSVSVLSSGREIKGDCVVVAGGSWSSGILGQIEYDPLIRPARGLVLLFSTGGESIMSVSALLEDDGIGMAQHDRNTVRITSFFEMVGFREDFGRRRKDWLLGVAMKHLTKFASLALVSEGVGYRPCTPDQLPVIGRVPKFRNLFVASGNCRLGVTLAPATGEIIASLVGGAQKEFWSYFDPGRFAR